MSGLGSFISCTELYFIRTQEKRICKDHEGGIESYELLIQKNLFLASA